MLTEDIESRAPEIKSDVSDGRLSVLNEKMLALFKRLLMDSGHQNESLGQDCQWALTSLVSCPIQGFLGSEDLV